MSVTKQARIELKIIGQDDTVNQVHPDGSRTMRFFAECNPSEARYWIEFNDDDQPCLWKSFSPTDKKNYHASCVPCISQKYVDALNEGLSVLIDSDIVVKA